MFIWVPDFASGILRLGVSRDTIYTFSTDRHPFIDTRISVVKTVSPEAEMRSRH